MTLHEEYEAYVRDCWLWGEIPESFTDWLHENYPNVEAA